jgi:hypothetical protein
MASGTLVATGTALAGGCNEFLAHRPLVVGTYHVLVSSQHDSFATDFLDTLSPVLSDFNQNGRVTPKDFSYVMTALTDLQSYRAACGRSAADLQGAADFNHEALVTNQDIQGLLALCAAL